MLNLQPIEKNTHHSQGWLDVVEIWDTIQGEGPYVGMPAIFVRLAGCNLQCPLCDTDYTTNRVTIAPDALIAQIERSPLYQRDSLVVFTGGEPFRQNISPVVSELADRGMIVQIETNGTLFPEDPNFPFEDISIICSPKTPLISRHLARRVWAWKYVVQEGQVDEDNLPKTALGGMRPYRPRQTGWGSLGGAKVYIQPCDEQDTTRNRLNMQEAVRICMQTGYRLCLQVHKIAGMR